MRGGDLQRLSVVGGFAGALAADHDVDAVITEDALQQHDVGQSRHVVENEHLLGEETRDHQRQRCVFRAGNRDGALEPPAADNTYAIHRYPRGTAPLKSLCPRSYSLPRLRRKSGAWPLSSAPDAPSSFASLWARPR